MKATVYFVDLTEAQRAELNKHGWGGYMGTAYLAAKDGQLDIVNVALFKKAARSGKWPNSEAVWITMQNVDSAWADNPCIECLTDFPRSMDVGDVIVWEDGRAERCAAAGFEPLPDFVNLLGRSARLENPWRSTYCD